MLLLTSTSDIVRVITSSGGASIQPHASWIDNASGTITPGRTNTAAITSATTTTVVGSPSASTQRNVKKLSLVNGHASASETLVVEHFDGTTATDLTGPIVLRAGEWLEFDQRGRWTHYDSNGTPYDPAPKLDVCLYKTADQAFATAASFADITDLTVALKSGKKYAFEAVLFHISNATTTGAQFAVNIGAAPTSLIVGNIDTVTNSVTASAHSSGVQTARDTALTAQTTGSAANAIGFLAGFIIPSADGTFALRATSEVTVAAGLTVKAGSWLRIRECDN
jgi:hypothetical protein